MIIPEFQQHELDPALLGEDITDAFQRFVYDCLYPEYPGLHLFPTGGKDGAIDLSADPGAELKVGECKFVGRNDLRAAQDAWKDVSEHLRKHLQSPTGPTRGQGQYAPWYRKDRPIREYFFCVSARVKNQSQDDTLQQHIQREFETLTHDFPHLNHLAGLKVRVFDWGDFEGILQQRALLQFRWFRRARPTGIRVFSDADLAGSFRTYLNSDAIPYYSRSRFLQDRPDLADAGIAGEEELLASLERGEWDGLVITGPGGTGKTRLTLELARLAQRCGWLVLTVGPSVRTQDLDAVVARLSPSDRVLLVIDYLERQRHFEELRERLHDIRDSFGLSLHYVANCRSSYYQHQITHSDTEQGVSLTAPESETWNRELRLQVVRHILTHAGIEVTPTHLERCRDVPALAMFMAFLHSQGRGIDLGDLLAEKDFANWVDRRVSLTFPGMDVSRELALLVAILPLSTTAVNRLEGPARSLLGRLAEDGWVIQSSSDVEEAPQWRALHDVLSDEIVLHHLEGSQATAQLYGTELLAMAAELRCLRPALETLQRLVDQPRIAGVTWLSLIRKGIQSNPDAWREARDLVLRTPLLETRDQFLLLHEHPGLWEGDHRETWFQNILGHLARWLVREAQPDLGAEALLSFKSWVERAAGAADESNFVLNWGLRLYPEWLQEAALGWIERHPVELQTHFLLVSWLEAGLIPATIEEHVRHWLTQWRTHPKASFVFRAWLEHGGSLAQIETRLLAWIEQHGSTPDARFVYPAWLEHGGPLAPVETRLLAWIEQHGRTPEASFVFVAYLNHGGSLAPVETRLLAWIEQHGRTPEARFVFVAYLNHGGSLAQIETRLLAWIEQHGRTPEASFVYPGYLNHGGSLAQIETRLLAWIEQHGRTPEARFVFVAYLNHGGSLAQIETRLLAWIEQHGRTPEASFVYPGYLNHGGSLAQIETRLLAWIEQHGRTPEARFVFVAYLNHGGSLAQIETRLLAWIEQHGRTPEASFVYPGYLNHGGTLAQVQTSLLAWIEQHGSRPDADFVYRVWLEHGGPLAPVETPLLAWIEQHGGHLDANYVIAAYLNNGGAVASVEAALLAWLDRHGSSLEASFVYSAWLENGGGLPNVATALAGWLLTHRNLEVATFVLTWVTKEKNLSDDLLIHSLYWCRHFPNHPDVMWRLSRLNRQLQREGFEDQVLLTAEAVLGALFGCSEIEPVSGKQIGMVLHQLVGAPGMQEGSARERVDRLLLTYLEHPCSRQHPAEEYVRHWSSLIARVDALLESETFWSDSDRRTKERCAEWMEQFANWKSTWDRMVTAHANDATLTATVTARVKGGLVVDLGVRGFVPNTHIGSGNEPNPERYVDTQLPLKVVEVDRARQKLVLSHRRVFEVEQAALREETLRTITTGQVRSGVVARLVDYGAFVDLGGIDGLLHISELSWTRIRHPTEMLNKGDEIQVMVCKTDLEQGRISLSMRQTQPDPWPHAPGRYSPGAVVAATVVRRASKGVLVMLEGGLEGFVNLEEAPEVNAGTSAEDPQTGDTLPVRIVELDPEERRLVLVLAESEPASPVGGPQAGSVQV